jgi:hypothetical protein
MLSRQIYWGLLLSLGMLLGCQPTGKMPTTPAPVVGTTPATTSIAGGGQVVTPKDSPLVLRAGVARIDEVGFLMIPGEVENRTGKWLTGMMINVKLYDKAGQELTVGNVMGSTDQGVVTDNEIIGPNEVGAFMYLRDTQRIKGTYDHYQLSVEAREADHGATYGEVSEVKITKDKDTSFIEVTGKITSKGVKPCKWPGGVAIAYDAKGQVYLVNASGIGKSTEEPVKTLSPGQSGAFSILFDNTSGEIKNIKVLPACGIMD